MAKVKSVVTSTINQPPLLVVPVVEPKTPKERHTSKEAIAMLERIQQLHVNGNLKIERLILHGLDNKRGELKLVDDPVMLTDESERFFVNHIRTGALRANWCARFCVPYDDMPALCSELLGSQERFVDASRKLARRLFDQMRPRTISEGDFVAAIYASANDGQRHIALLKLDPDERLVRNFVTVSGRVRVDISLTKNNLPDTARLQKCALITSSQPSPDFDVALLDTQAGPRKDGIATFFYRGFLNAELMPTPRRRTLDFIRCGDAWLTQHQDMLQPSEVTTFYTARRALLSQDSIDVSDFVSAALPAQPDLSLDLRNQLERTLEPYSYSEPNESVSFTVDASVAEPIINRIVLELDGGARLIVPADRFSDLVHIEDVLTAENRYRITIESQTLREISER